MIAFQPCVWVSGNFADRLNLQQALGSNADPLYFSLLWDAAQVLPLNGFVVAHLQTPSFQKLFTFKVAINTQQRIENQD